MIRRATVEGCRRRRPTEPEKDVVFVTVPAGCRRRRHSHFGERASRPGWWQVSAW